MPEWMWRIAEPLLDGDVPELGTWPLPLRQLLYNRGLCSLEDVEDFLHPEKGTVHDPFALLGMDRAVDRIYRALREEELIAIYGDFDVDGLTAVALLFDVLRSPALQGRVVSYLPHRSREGYGLHNEAIRSLAERGAKLLITVDCGIGADDQVRYASTLGLDVIVTDHHLVSRGVPPALAVINARQDGCAYPFKELSGVGMAYKLAEALFSRLWGADGARERLLPYMDLVALGTIADVAPLVGENRRLTKLGLEQMARGNRVGLQALLRSSGWGQRAVDSDCVSYIIAPRLNAAGRMGDARISLDLLLCDSETDAEQMAAQLEDANRSRQAATALALNSARQELQELPEVPPAIVVSGDYPAGIAGLVAGKLADEYRRATFVVELGQEESRGSCRGVPGFDVVEALSGCSELLSRYGGHSQAGGFALATPHVAAFKKRMEAAAADRLGPAAESRELLLDAKLQLSAVGPDLYHQLRVMEPHGCGNPRPLFCSHAVRIRDVRTVGNGHLKMWVSDDTATRPAIGFGLGNGAKPFAKPGALVDCAYSVARDRRGDAVSYELNLKDIRPSTAAPKVL